jgi:hypothetical protein
MKPGRTKHLAGICALLASALLGCSSGPVAPDWQGDAFAAANSFTQAYLRGEQTLASHALARARSAVAQTGRPERMARLELLACALQVASLEFNDCPAYRRLAMDAQPPEQAYAAFLSGQWQGLKPEQLPSTYQAFVRKAGTGATSDHLLDGIEQPLSRLIAAGVLQRRGHIGTADLQTASDTASDQGWRRPLMAWLGWQLQQVQGDAATAARLQRRIDLAAPPKRSSD